MADHDDLRLVRADAGQPLEQPGRHHRVGELTQPRLEPALAGHVVTAVVAVDQVGERGVTGIRAELAIGQSCCLVAEATVVARARTRDPHDDSPVTPGVARSTVGEGRPQLGAAAVDAAAYGAELDAEDVGDLLVRQPLDVAEDDGRAVLRQQRVERGLDVVVEVRVLVDLGRRQPRGP